MSTTRRLAGGVRRRLGPHYVAFRSRLPWVCRVRLSGNDNRVDRSAARGLRHVSVTVDGNSNSVAFHPDARIESSSFVVRGDNNRITVGGSFVSGMNVILTGDDNEILIGEGCMLLATVLVCEDSGNAITIGDFTEVHGSTQLAALEGTRIDVGERCLFSGGIQVRTGDSHSMTDLDGRRINPSKDVFIADHVWVGTNVTVLKGSSVPASSVVGAQAVVTRRFEAPHVALGGNPARVIREGIDWKSERIPCDPV